MYRTALPLAFLLSLACLAPQAAEAKVEVKEEGGRYKVTFSHQPVIAVKSVVVAGSFNGWSKDASPLRDDDGDGKPAAAASEAPATEKPAEEAPAADTPAAESAGSKEEAE